MEKKILVTTGTRADYGFLKPLLSKIKTNDKLTLILIVTGTHLSQKHGLTIAEIKQDGFKISDTVNMMPKNNSLYDMSITLGSGVVSFSKIFKKFQPDLNIILGDRDEMLASALASYHMNIPNVHIHGGDTSGGIDEYTRHAITKISNIHFPATKKSKSRIIRMGENPKFVFLTGSPAIDALSNKNYSTKEQLEKKYHITFTGKEILLIQHSVTTQTKDSLNQICQTLKAITKLKNTTIAILPNSDAGSKEIIEQLYTYAKKYKFIKVFPTIPRNDYLGMIKNCGVLIGNSSSGVIEASYFDTPVINLGQRQQKRETTTSVINIKNPTTTSIYKNIKKSFQLKSKPTKNSLIYGRGNASAKIVKILETIEINHDLIEKSISY